LSSPCEDERVIGKRENGLFVLTSRQAQRDKGSQQEG